MTIALKKLRLRSSTIDIGSGGSIFGGNAGTRLEIDPVVVFTGGSGTLSGPLLCDSTGCTGNPLPITL